MDERTLFELRQVLVEEICLPLKSLGLKLDAMQAQMELWTRSTQERLASFKTEQAVRRCAGDQGLKFIP